MKQTLEISAMLLFGCFILVGYQAIKLDRKCEVLESKLRIETAQIDSIKKVYFDHINVNCKIIKIK